MNQVYSGDWGWVLRSIISMNTLNEKVKENYEVKEHYEVKEQT